MRFQHISFKIAFAYALYTIGFFLIAVPAFAQGLVPCEGIDCQTCHLFRLVDNIIRYAIILSIPLATILFAYAGFLLFKGGGGEASTTAKRIFSDVLFGLFLAVGGYLIIDTILKSLAAKDFTGPSWTAIQCQSRSVGGGGLSFGNPEATTPSEDGLVAANPQQNAPGTVTEGTFTDAAARDVLDNLGGFSYASSGNCTAQVAGCTSLQGIRQDTINQIVYFQQACQCQITITGGTEPGHSTGATDSHTAGYKIDIGPSSQIDSYIQNNFNFVGPRPGDGAQQYRDRYGNVYAREGNHWDILVKSTGSYK